MSRLLALLAALTLLAALPTAAAHAKRSPAKTQSHHKKAKKLKAPKADWDNDGLNNRYEKKAGTKPRLADTDRDGTLDGREDRDADEVSNRTEQLAVTNPRMADSDRDGLSDPDEDPDADGVVNRSESLLSWHPRNADTDDDGVQDGDENAGVVSATTPETVTIALLRGGSLSAKLTEFTDVRCASSVAAEENSDEQELTEAELEAAELESETEDAAAEDGFADEDFEDEPRARVAALNGCSIDVGAVVSDAEVESFEGVLEYLSLDLLGS
ncbi:MAG: hypothetical protein WKF94_05605 [Solirubrobacteraceae bacterium]